MKYCEKCNTKIKPNSKFCTHCGTPITIKESNQKVESYEKPKKPSSMIKKIVISGIVIVVAFFLAKTYIPEFEDFVDSLSSQKELTQLVGKWQDPTGQFLQDAQNTIVFRKMGDALVGEDDNKEIYIKLLHYSKNTYGGSVIINRTAQSYEVSYYKKEDKLVFFSTRTKTSWYIRRAK